tara:strand:+ start:89 stop:289 length:201 start_codon:yes stop_codon:yes gene_type:complete
MSASPKDSTSAVTELMEVGTDMKTELKSTKSAKKYSTSSDGATIAILFLGFWGVCSVILLTVARLQ